LLNETEERLDRISALVVLANVVGAYQAVVAGTRVSSRDAANERVARIGGTYVSIVTVRGKAPCAHALTAGLQTVARVVVGTVSAIVRNVQAAGFGIAGVIGAGVAVFT